MVLKPKSTISACNIYNKGIQKVIKENCSKDEGDCEIRAVAFWLSGQFSGRRILIKVKLLFVVFRIWITKGWENLKKYVVFLISFVLLYLTFEIFTGWILTALYTPDFSLINNTSSQEALLVGQNSIVPFLSALSIATIAYFMSEFICKKANRNNIVKWNDVEAALLSFLFNKEDFKQWALIQRKD